MRTGAKILFDFTIGPLAIFLVAFGILFFQTGVAAGAEAKISCDDSLPRVIRKELRQVVPWYRPITLGRLQKAVDEKVQKEKAADGTTTKKKLDLAILQVAAKYRAQLATKLSNRAIAAYAAGGIASGTLMLTVDWLKEPYKSAGKIFVLSYAIEINRALASLGSDRIAAKVRSWAANGKTSLHPDVVDHFLRVAQESTRTMDPTQEAGSAKINDAIKTILVALDKVDTWRELSRSNPARAGILNTRAAILAGQMVRVYVEHYPYLQPQEDMLTPIFTAFFAEDDVRFRRMIEKAIASNTESRLTPEEIKQVLDAWMPHTLKKPEQDPGTT